MSHRVSPCRVSSWFRPLQRRGPACCVCPLEGMERLSTSISNTQPQVWIDRTQTTVSLRLGSLEKNMSGRKLQKSEVLTRQKSGRLIISQQPSCLDDVAADRIQSKLQKVEDNAANPCHKTLKSSFSSKLLLPCCSKEHYNTVSHSHLLQLDCTTPPYNCHSSSAHRSVLHALFFIYIVVVFLVSSILCSALGQVLCFMSFCLANFL